MELIKISDSKLKIALTPTDMEKYSLDIQTMDYDKTETRSAFWQLLDEAKHKTGFDAASEKIFVQIYSSVGGGCEMYVTKLKKTAENSDDKDYTCVPVNRNRPHEQGGRNVRKGQSVQDGQNISDGKNGRDVSNGRNMPNGSDVSNGRDMSNGRDNMQNEKSANYGQNETGERNEYNIGYNIPDAQTVQNGCSEPNGQGGQDMRETSGAANYVSDYSEDGLCEKSLHDAHSSLCSENGESEYSSGEGKKESDAALTDFLKDRTSEAMSEVRCICRVSALDELLQLCLYAKNHLDVSESSAYLEKTSDGKYYYLVFSYRIGAGCRESEIPESIYLSEFGSLMKEKTGVYIAEHCQCLCEEDAVKTLAALL